jgi:nicotinate-nucleotide adenylyltransferase
MTPDALQLLREPPTPDSGPIGLLGGSFDPIHVGHVRLARDAMEQLKLTRVLFVPAGLAWQKGPATDAAHRARMVELAIAGEPAFALDRRELQRPGPSFTVDTLQQLRLEAGATRPLVLLIGADQFERLDTWHQWERLIELAHLGVAGRPGHDAQPAPALARWREQHRGGAADVAQRPAGLVVPVAMQPVDCSSTHIRALLRGGAPQAYAAVAPMLAPAVLDYIRTHRLYS